MGGTLFLSPRGKHPVAFVPERGGDEKRWLLPDFEVIGRIASIAVISVLPGDSLIETEASGCDGEVSGAVPFWLLSEPNVDPGWVTYKALAPFPLQAGGNSLTEGGIEFIELNGCVEVAHKTFPDIAGDRHKNLGVEEVADQDKLQAIQESIRRQEWFHDNNRSKSTAIAVWVDQEMGGGVWGRVRATRCGLRTLYPKRGSTDRLSDQERAE